MAKKIKKRTVMPTPDQVVLRAQEINKVQGDIIIPETAKMPVRLDHVVLAIGSNVRKEVPQLKLGSKVIIKKNFGVDFTLDNIDYVIVKAENIEAYFCGISDK